MRSPHGRQGGLLLSLSLRCRSILHRRILVRSSGSGPSFLQPPYTTLHQLQLHSQMLDLIRLRTDSFELSGQDIKLIWVRTCMLCHRRYDRSCSQLRSSLIHNGDQITHLLVKPANSIVNTLQVLMMSLEQIVIVSDLLLQALNVSWVHIVCRIPLLDLVLWRSCGRSS